MTPTIDTLPQTPDIAPLPPLTGASRPSSPIRPGASPTAPGQSRPEHRRLDRYGTLTSTQSRPCPSPMPPPKMPTSTSWVPNALPLEGIDVLQAWGRYVSNVIWAKRRKDGDRRPQGSASTSATSLSRSCSVSRVPCGPCNLPGRRST